MPHSLPDNPTMQKRQRFAERFARLGVFMCIAAAGYYYFGLGYSILAACIATSSVLFVLALLAIKKGWLLLGRYILCLGSCTLISATTFFTSADTFFHVYYFPLSICTYMLFSPAERGHVYLLLVNYIGAFVWFQFFPFDLGQPRYMVPPENVNLIRGITLLAALLVSLYAARVMALLGDEAENELAKSAQFKDRINSILAHDLRTPVSTAHSLLNLMAEEESETEKKRYFEMLRQTCTNMDQLIANVLELSKMEHVNRLKRSGVNMADFIDKCIEKQENYLTLRQVKINRSYPQRPALAYVDQRSFAHVVDNLLTNAIKFSHDGGKIDLGVNETGNLVQVWVRDHGIGISEAEQATLFHKFSAGRPGIRGEASTGLGMYIAKYITELNKGRIWVESVEGRGTKVNIELEAA